MIVLNIFSKIEPICISKKLGLYIDNVPNDWKSELKERIVESKNQILKNQAKYNINNKYDFDKKYRDILKEEYNGNDSEEAIVDKIVDRMIYIYFNYEYDDMPLGDWSTNCFDGRFCEEDYAEKLVDFMSFAFNRLKYEEKTSLCYIYSSNYDRMQNEYQIFYSNKECLKGINTLIKWGELFDNNLNEKNDYLKFDYIINAIHQDSNNNEYQFFKFYSICQLFLEKSTERELDWKLPIFIGKDYSLEEKTSLSPILRKMRNKIAHGDFVALENIMEEYSKIAMIGFRYDYSEYSRRNWILLNVCCLMEEIIRELIKMMFYNSELLQSIKDCTSKEKFTLVPQNDVLLVQE